MPTRVYIDSLSYLNTQVFKRSGLSAYTYVHRLIVLFEYIGVSEPGISMPTLVHIDSMSSLNTLMFKYLGLSAYAYAHRLYVLFEYICYRIGSLLLESSLAGHHNRTQ